MENLLKFVKENKLENEKFSKVIDKYYEHTRLSKYIGRKYEVRDNSYAINLHTNDKALPSFEGSSFMITSNPYESYVKCYIGNGKYGIRPKMMINVKSESGKEYKVLFIKEMVI